jgi:YfiR/HmsC-like
MALTPVRTMGLLTLLLLASLPLAAADRGEYEVKAAFLINFTHFVEFPAGSQTGPFNLCVIGPDPFGDVLEKVVGNRMVGNQAIVIKRLASAAGGNVCAIAFVGDIDKQTLLKLSRNAELSHALTVGDSEKFAERYGVIGFVVENSRVGLVLNADRANQHGLKINSQLMRVAKPVGSAGEGQP